MQTDCDDIRHSLSTIDIRGGKARENPLFFVKDTVLSETVFSGIIGK